MAHKIVNHNGEDIVLIDWSTGDPEGDRQRFLKAVKQFIDELITAGGNEVKSVADKWKYQNLDIEGREFGIEKPL